jgi:uncharacterized protein YndB with AHSA1/START domain
MSEQILIAKTQMGILKPLHKVFEAIVNNNKMNKYFISTGSGRIESGKLITWTWDDYNATHKIKVEKVEKDKYISLKWDGSGVETLTEIFFEQKSENLTLVKITESGWSVDFQGANRCMAQTEGWTHFLCCLKAYVEYNIDLRLGGIIR